MDPRLKKTIVGASLCAFGAHTLDLAHEGIIGHELPSALQLVASFGGGAASTGASTVFVVASFGNASTEAVYPNLPDAKVLKNDGQMVLPPSKAGPKA
jgi:hypothetical protein